jgi:hypothetical protein
LQTCQIFVCFVYSTSRKNLNHSRVKCTLVQALKLCTGRTAHGGEG